MEVLKYWIGCKTKINNTTKQKKYYPTDKKIGMGTQQKI